MTPVQQALVVGVLFGILVGAAGAFAYLGWSTDRAAGVRRRALGLRRRALLWAAIAERLRRRGQL